MRTPARRQPFRYDEFYRRRANLAEYYGYPSELALDLWEHVLGIGTSRCPQGHNRRVGGKRSGYLLHYIRKGEFSHVVNGRTYRAGPGDLCLLDYGKEHRGFNPGQAAVHLWYVLFAGKDAARSFTELGADTDPIFRGVGRKRFESLFHQLWNLTTRKPPGYEAQAHAVLHTMLADLFTARAERTRSTCFLVQRSRLSEKVRLAVDLLEQNHYMNLGLKQIQSVVGMDMYHFSRKFRAEVGMAPIQYLNRYRLEIAKQILATSDKPISEVARLVGLPNESYFIQLFRRQVGQTPRAFRQNARFRRDRGS
jgi:AraC-like DNA-binding protein